VIKYNFKLDEKFVTLAVDVASGLLLYFVGKYAPASIFDDVKVFWLALQPLVAALIAGIYAAEQATIRAGLLPRSLK
jgi:hypothetical protein